MDVASFCSLPVGVLAWNAPRPVATVIVKATFSLDRDGAATLAKEQEPLSVDRRQADSDTELYYGSDFVPLKKAADVLVVGHAWAQDPRIAVPFALSVGTLQRRLVARGDRVARAQRLLGPNLREQEAGAAPAGRLAPAVQEVARWHERTVTSDFDFTRCNAALARQRVSSSVAGARLTLEGLLPNAPLRQVELPRQPPWLFHTPDRGGEARGLEEKVVLACDTLWVDTDRGLLTMTWRGVVPRPRLEGARPTLVIALPNDEPAPTWTEVTARLGEAQWTTAATEQSCPHLPPVQPAPRRPAADGATPYPDRPSSDAEATALLDVDDTTAPGGLIPQPPQTTLPFTPPVPVPEIRGLPDFSIPVDHEDTIRGMSPRVEPPRTWAMPDLSTPVAHEDTIQGLSPPAPAAETRANDPGTTGHRWPKLDGAPPGTEPEDEQTADRHLSSAPPPAEPPAGKARARAWDRAIDDETTAGLPDDAPGATTSSRPPAGSEHPQAPSTAPTAPDPDATEELAPITPRTGLRLGQAQGFALGGAMLGRGKEEALPFSGSAERQAGSSSIPPAPDEPPRPAGAGPTLVLEPDEDPATDEAVRTHVLDLDDQLAAALSLPTPFGGAEATPRAGGLAPPTPRYDSEEATLTAVELPLPNQPALPFAPSPDDGDSDQPPATSPVPGATSPATPPPRPPVPRPPQPMERPEGADRPVEGASQAGAPTTTPMVTVERYAAVKAALWHEDEPMDVVLAKHGFDETAWRSIERRQAKAIARDAAAGGQLAVEIREAIAQARGKLARGASAPELSLENYAKLRVAVDDADDPSLVLGKRGLSASDWEWLQRTWAHRAKADGRVAARLRRQLAAARLGTDDDD